MPRSPSRCSRSSTRPPTGASRSRTAGAAAGSRSSRCGPSSSPRCATTRCRADGSATARSCCASGPTRIRARARGPSCARRAIRGGLDRAPTCSRAEPGSERGARCRAAADSTIRSRMRVVRSVCSGSTSSGSPSRTARTNWLTLSSLPLARAAASIASAPTLSTLIGFSQRTCLPASSAATATGRGTRSATRS